MDDIIQGQPQQSVDTVDVYILMYRFGANHWAASMTYPTAAQAQENASYGEGVTAWKIVKVSGLPIEVKAGEANVQTDE